MARPRKPKAINYELISPDEFIYRDLLSLVKRHHSHLNDARIGMAWRRALKPDPDGRLVLGKCKKASDLDRELAAFDFVILLNQEAWNDLDHSQREALLDHELCHAQVARTKDGDPKMDEKGRIVYRLRKHDIEEFSEVVERHGLYKADLAAFAEKCAARRKAPLFADVPEEPPTNGEAPSGERPARPKRTRPSRRKTADVPAD
jgi:hypothetical protein